MVPCSVERLQHRACIRARGISHGPALVLAVQCLAQGGHAFETERLRIESQRSDDLDAMIAAMDDPEARSWEGWTTFGHHDFVRTATLTDERRRRGDENLVIRDKSTRQVIGARWVHRIRDDGCYIGTVIAAGWRGKGLGTEELTATLAFLHGHLALRLVFSETEVGNTASQRQMTKAGMTQMPSGDMRTLEDGRSVQTVMFRSRVNKPVGSCSRWPARMAQAMSNDTPPG